MYQSLCLNFEKKLTLSNPILTYFFPFTQIIDLEVDKEKNDPEVDEGVRGGDEVGLFVDDKDEGSQQARLGRTKTRESVLNIMNVLAEKGKVAEYTFKGGEKKRRKTGNFPALFSTFDSGDFGGLVVKLYILKI